MQEKLVTFTLILALVLIAIAQSYNFLSVYGIKVNLILVFLIVLSLFLENQNNYLLILIIGAMLSSLDAWLSREFIAVLGAGLVVLFLRKRLIAPGIAGNVVFIALATFILYLILSPRFILSSVFYIELLLSEIVGLALFILFAKITGFNYKRI